MDLFLFIKNKKLKMYFEETLATLCFWDFCSVCTVF